MRLPHLTGCIAAMTMAIAASMIGAPQSHAQSADLVLCDRLAADSTDPDKPADVKGVPEVAASDIPTAIKYCKTAGNSSRRALYELGRAYAANRQLPEAMAVWRKAADEARLRRWSSSACSTAAALALPEGRRAGAKVVRARAARPSASRGISIWRRFPALAVHRLILRERAKCWQSRR